MRIPPGLKECQGEKSQSEDNDTILVKHCIIYSVFKMSLSTVFIFFQFL